AKCPTAMPELFYASTRSLLLERSILLDGPMLFHSCTYMKKVSACFCIPERAEGTSSTIAARTQESASRLLPQDRCIRAHRPPATARWFIRVPSFLVRYGFARALNSIIKRPGSLIGYWSAWEMLGPIMLRVT